MAGTRLSIVIINFTSIILLCLVAFYNLSYSPPFTLSSVFQQQIPPPTLLYNNRNHHHHPVDEYYNHVKEKGLIRPIHMSDRRGGNIINNGYNRIDKLRRSIELERDNNNSDDNDLDDSLIASSIASSFFLSPPSIRVELLLDSWYTTTKSNTVTTSSSNLYFLNQITTILGVTFQTIITPLISNLIRMGRIRSGSTTISGLTMKEQQQEQDWIVSNVASEIFPNHDDDNNNNNNVDANAKSISDWIHKARIVHYPTQVDDNEWNFVVYVPPPSKITTTTKTSYGWEGAVYDSSRNMAAVSLDLTSLSSLSLSSLSTDSLTYVTKSCIKTTLEFKTVLRRIVNFDNENNDTNYRIQNINDEKAIIQKASNSILQSLESTIGLLEGWYSTDQNHPSFRPRTSNRNNSKSTASTFLLKTTGWKRRWNDAISASTFVEMVSGLMGREATTRAITLDTARKIERCLDLLEQTSLLLLDNHNDTNTITTGNEDNMVQEDDKIQKQQEHHTINKSFQNLIEARDIVNELSIDESLMSGDYARIEMVMVIYGSLLAPLITPFIKNLIKESTRYRKLLKGKKERQQQEKENDGSGSNGDKSEDGRSNESDEGKLETEQIIMEHKVVSDEEEDDDDDEEEEKEEDEDNDDDDKEEEENKIG